MTGRRRFRSKTPDPVVVEETKRRRSIASTSDTADGRGNTEESAGGNDRR